MMKTRGRRREGRIRTAQVVAAIVATAMLVGSCRNIQQSASQPSSGVLRVGTAQLTASNPITGLRQLSQLLSVEGLVRVGENGRLEPALAEKWSTTNERRSLVVTLRSGVKFHDGAPLDANAVAELLP